MRSKKNKQKKKQKKKRRKRIIDKIDRSKAKSSDETRQGSWGLLARAEEGVNPIGGIYSALFSRSRL